MLKKLIAMMTTAFILTLPFAVQASDQIATTNQISVNNEQQITTSGGIWDFLVGEAPQDAVNFGMVTWHFSEQSRQEDRWNNMSLGITYNSIFIGTLLNSFSDRAFVLGLQRNLWQSNTQNHDWNMNVGYRLGIITGYDQRMSRFGMYSPVMPFPQLYTQFGYKDFGIELSWVAVVFTAQLYYRF